MQRILLNVRYVHVFTYHDILNIILTIYIICCIYILPVIFRKKNPLRRKKSRTPMCLIIILCILRVLVKFIWSLTERPTIVDIFFLYSNSSTRE